MKKILIFIFSAGFLLLSNIGFAQNASDLRINEVLVTNINDFQDDFGQQEAWVEIFNTSYGTVNIGGCYLTDDISNPTKYFIPKGDVLTQIKPRQHILFWVDDLGFRGTFHVNFKFDPTKENFIALFDSNGRTLIDSLTIPVLAPNVSFGLPEDGIRFIREKDANGQKVTVDLATALPNTTPSTNNHLKDQDSANQRLISNDPTGLGMAATAMMVVFTVLILLYGVFRYTGHYNVKKSKKNALKAQGLPTNNVKESTVVPGEGSGELYAAIAYALYLYQNEIHDEESAILTIDKVTRDYSPWSSKIYTLRQTPTVNKK
ncbi:MAG: OadG family protein [Prevotellaceae bacterium]|jgi:hypothetical protein|nr:OadG family protein [Prevotellaceae bacterium]